MHLCIYMYILHTYYEGKWQSCHSESPSQVGGAGQHEPYEMQRGQMQSPASGKKETLAEIQARAAWQECILSGSNMAPAAMPGTRRCC